MFFIMRKNSYSFFLILFYFIPGLIQAQVKDAGLWTSINLEKKFNKKWSLNLTEEIRFNENISELGMSFSELSATYQYNKMFGISAGYRFIQKRQVDDYYSMRHRYLVNINVKNKFKLFSTNLRIRYQRQYSDVYSSRNGSEPSDYIRTKLAVKYSTGKKYTPVISGELFFNTNAPDGLLMDDFRIAAGVEYEFSKRSSLELGYLIDRELQVVNPLTSYVILLGWNYTLK